MTDDAKSQTPLTCRYCQGQFPELVERCPWCGKQIAFHCANCGELTDGSTPLCVHCGQPHSPFAESSAPLPKVVPNAPPPQAPAPVETAHKDAPPVVVIQTPTPVAAPPEPPVEVVATWRELRGPWRMFAMSEWIMRDRVSFFDEVRTRHDLSPKLRSMVISTIIYLALYGIVMGISNSWQQAVMSAIKLPVLFLVTLLICLPTLYFFNLLYGSQLTFAQTAALMMAAVTVTAALTLAFASITLFFWLTVPDYGFFILLNVGVLGAGVFAPGDASHPARRCTRTDGTHPGDLDRHLCFRRHADGLGTQAILRRAGPSVRDHPPHRGHILYQRIPYHPGHFGIPRIISGK